MRTASSPEQLAAAVSDLFGGVFAMLADWSAAIAHEFPASASPAALDDFVAARALPPLVEPDPLLIGAGFIASPDFVHGRDVHFAWWLGPLDAGPIFGSTTEPTRLDLSTRGYADYLRDVRTLEWWAAPAATASTHVTGPYVDHLCSCDYIFTLTTPVYAGDELCGVVGADIPVRRLERELIGAVLDCAESVAILGSAGRVVLSSDPSLPAGSLFTETTDSVVCPGTPLRIARLTAASVDRIIANRMI